MSTNYISQITATDGVTYDVQEGVTTRIFRATCTTSAGTAAKVATLDDATGYSLAAGVRVAVTFTYGNTATSPTLNVNSGGAKYIYYSTAITTYQKVDELCVWGANETVIFTYNGSSWVMMGSSLALYNAYNKAASSGSGTITEVKTNAGAHTPIDVLSGKAEFNVPTTAAHVGAATSDHAHGNITNGGDITATAPTIASGDQIIINDNSASKITNGPTFDGSTTTTALTPKGTWESFSKFSGSYNDLTNKPTIPSYSAGTGLSLSGTTFNHSNSVTAGTAGTSSATSGTTTLDVPYITYDAQGHITGSGAHTHTISSFPEAYLAWGGKDFSASYGPIDAAMIDVLGANRFAFLKAAGLTVEYSTNGGSTWTDYGAADTAKVGLFGGGYSFYLGKASAKANNTINNQLRVTISTSAAGIYTTLNKIAIYMSTSGNTVQVLIERALESTPTTFATHKDWTGISGWSGWNILNIGGLTTYGNTADAQYGRIRFTFKQTAINSNYPSASIIRIMGFGGVGWSVPSNMARDGHLYSYDSSQNATFPAQVTATQFNGNLTGNVTGNVSGSAGSVPWSGVSSKPTSTGSATTSVTASTTATKTTLGTAFTIPNVTSAGSASTWAFEEVSIPNVTAAGSASTWAFEEVSIPNVTAAGSASTWTFGSTTVGDGTLVGAVDSSDSSMLVITAGTKSVQQKTGGGNGTAPTIGTAIKVQSKKSGANGTAPTIGTAIKVQSKKSGANGSAPTLGTAFTVPNVTGNTSATVSISDSGHTHTLS